MTVDELIAQLVVFREEGLGRAHIQTHSPIMGTNTISIWLRKLDTASSVTLFLCSRGGRKVKVEKEIA